MGQASWGHRDLPVSISLELANKYASPRPDFLGAGDITQDLTLTGLVSLLSLWDILGGNKTYTT